MATNSKIEWTDVTWNPVTGCSKISDGCKNCYAERMAKRLYAMRQPRYKNGFQVTLHSDLIELPTHWTKPRMIFVNSMSDLFHEDVPFEFIKQIFKTMKDSPQHIFQVLTKRSKRLREICHLLPWPENIWMGVSVENQKVLGRIIDIKEVPCAVRFLSCEPLIGPLNDMPLNGIQWVIVGGESGPYARPMKKEWVESILQECNRRKIAFFFKQWGGFNKKIAGRILNGKVYDEIPLCAYNHQSADAIFSFLPHI